MPLIAGPACGAGKYTGMFYGEYNTIGLTDATAIIEVENDRSRYGSFSAVLPSSEIFYPAIAAFIKAQGWSKVFLLSEVNADWTPVCLTNLIFCLNFVLILLQLEAILLESLYQLNISLIGTAKVPIPANSFPEREHFTGAVEELAKSGARIVVLHSSFSG